MNTQKKNVETGTPPYDGHPKRRRLVDKTKETKQSCEGGLYPD